MSFASNCCMIDDSERFHVHCVLKELQQLFFYQNVYPELLWKYTMSRYGYTKELSFVLLDLLNK